MSKATSERIRYFFTVDTIVYVVLLVFSFFGIAISDFSPQYSLWYWLAMVPIFGAVSIYNEWHLARLKGETRKKIIGKQLMHWLALAMTLYLVHMLQDTGRINMANAGLVALLALALTTFLAGVHFNWRYGVFGIVLGSTVAVAAILEEFFWIMFLPVLIAGLVTILWKRRESSD